MPSAKDVIILEEFFKSFVCGNPGTGKSVFASTFPTPGFVFDFDNGIKTYAGKDFNYESYKIEPAGWVKFEKDLIQVRKDVAEGKYKSVIVDSTSAMTDLAMERSMQLDAKRSATNGPLWNVHYQMVKNLMEGKLRQIINLDCNICVIAHLDIVTNQETGAIVAIHPLLTGTLSSKVPGYFDEVYYASTQTKEGKTNFRLQTVAKGYYHARSRISGVKSNLDEFVPNNFDDLIQMYKRKAKV